MSLLQHQPHALQHVYVWLKLLSLEVMREIHFLWCQMVHKKET